MIKHVKCVLCSYHIKTQSPLVVLFIPQQSNLHLCSKPTFCKNMDDWALGLFRRLTPRPADHRDLISCCHNIFSYISVWLLSQSRGYFLLQSSLLTVLSALCIGEQCRRPCSSFIQTCMNSATKHGSCQP